MRIDMKFSEGSDPTLMFLYVDNKMCDMTHGRIGSYVYGKPLSQWLHSYSKGMCQWNGLFPELSKVVNTKSYDLWISASSEVFEVIQTAALESECAIHVFQTEQTSSTNSMTSVLDELLALAKTRFLKKDLQEIQEMVGIQPLRIICDTRRNTSTFQLQLPDWVFNYGKYALPLAIVSGFSEISETARITQLSGLHEEQLLICIINADEGKCVGIANECRNVFKNATVFQLNKLVCQNLENQKEILNDVTEANVRCFLEELFQESNDSDWWDVEAARKVILTYVNQKEREYDQQREQCTV